MIVLGIDPGLAATGYGVVGRAGGRLLALDGGVVQTPAGAPHSERLRAVYDAVSAVLDEHRPDAMALEELYFGRNVTSAQGVAQARGVVMLAAAQREVPCEGYTPQQVKAAVCGSGRANKEQVARMVTALLALRAQPFSDHAADALAVAVCHINRAPVTAALAGALA